MDVMTRSAKRRGQYVELTGREFELLEYLLRHKGQGRFAGNAGARCVEGETRATPIDNVIEFTSTVFAESG